MNTFEKYKIIYKDEEGATLKPLGEACRFSFEQVAQKDTRYRLLIVGQTDLFYQWKSELDGFWLYHTLSDSLDYQHTCKSQYSLNVSAKTPNSYVWRTYKKVFWQEESRNYAFDLNGGTYDFGFYIKANDLRILDGGYLRMYIEVFYKTEGINIRSNRNKKSVYEITVPSGNYDWEKIEKEIQIDTDSVAFVGVWLEGTKYTGEVYIERPFMKDQNGVNNLPDFALPVSGNSELDWTSQYLNKKDVVSLSMSINGQEIFNGDILERIHTQPDFSIDLPNELLTGNTYLDIRLLSDYRDPLSYTVYEIALIEQNGGLVSLIATPEIVTANGKTYALIRTTGENTSFTVSYPDSEYLSGETSYHFKEKGLHVLKLQCHEPYQNAKFIISCEDTKIEGKIDRIVLKKDDAIITGTGDMIYVSQELADVEEYLSWYLSQDIGNLFTIRPTYRWGVARANNPEAWKLVNRILNEAGIYYTHIWDGRELPGISANPSTEELAGKYFLGHQQHERDSMVNGRGTQKFVSLFDQQRIDMENRAFDEDPDHTSIEHCSDFIVYEKDGVYNTRSPYVERDYKAGKEYIVQRLKDIRRNDIRHSGPESIFRYFVQAGYPFVAAETNYSSMEILLAYLRGTKKGYSLPSIGIHHALQWSMPVASELTYRRFEVALKVAYMQGVDCINTEEGLWHVEQGFKSGHRFSAPCQKYIDIQHSFYNYVRSHSRQGKFVTPFAVITGINDIYEGKDQRHGLGWTDCTVGEDIQSWQLLKTFYPLSGDDWLYVCATDAPKPFGYFTGTPHGNIDIIPAESSVECYNRYDCMAFIGYNTAEKETFDKLETFVRKGGKLILTRAHQTVTTNVADVSALRLSFDESLPLMFTNGKPEFRKTMFNGQEIETCINNTPCDQSVKNEEGLDIVCRYKLGKGEIVLFNVKAYPANPAISELYKQELTDNLQNSVQRQDVWVESNDQVEFSVYEKEDGKDIYMLAVDWYNLTDTKRTAKLKIGNDTYEVKLPFGKLMKCTVKDNIGAYCLGETGEILEISENSVVVQGIGKQNVTILRGGKVIEKIADFSKNTVIKLQI